MEALKAKNRLINLTAEYGLARGLPVGEHAPQPLCLLLSLIHSQTN
jgi:hypothetical protein